jgi:hypothetical protein
MRKPPNFLDKHVQHNGFKLIEAQFLGNRIQKIFEGEVLVDVEKRDIRNDRAFDAFFEVLIE